MAKSSSKSKSKNKKKTKKNSNYKNQVVEKKLPKPSEEKIRRQQKAEKEKKKAEIKAAKEALKKEKKLKKENKKKEISKPKKENNKEANKKEKPKEIIKEEIHIKKEESNNTVEEVKETVSVEENLQDNSFDTVEPEIPQKEEEPVISHVTEENIEEETEEISSVEDEETIEDEEVIEDGKAVEDEEVITDKEIIPDEDIVEDEVQNDIPEVETVPEIKEEKAEKPVRIVEETTVPEVEVKDGGTKIKKEKVKIKLTKKKILVLVAGVVAVAMAVSVIVALCGKVQKMNKPDAIVYNGRNYSEDELYSITIDDEQQETYVKNTKSKGDKGKFKFYAQTEFNLTDISSLIPISLGNPTTEKTVIVATICDEHETTLYRTLGIKPGFYLDEISLEKYLEYGENNLKLYVSAFRTVDNNGEKSYKKVGTQRVNLKVNVGEDFEVALG